jgi:hypothetical protein
MQINPARSQNIPELKICDPNVCSENCPLKEFNQDDCQRDYEEIVKKYSLIHHVEKSEFDEDGDYTVEVFSKVFCPPDSMYTYEKDVMNQFDQFFLELGISNDETGFAEGFFTSTAFVYPN